MKLFWFLSVSTYLMSMASMSPGKEADQVARPMDEFSSMENDSKAVEQYLRAQQSFTDQYSAKNK